MNTYKIYKAAFNLVKDFDFENGDLITSMNKLLSDLGLPAFIPEDSDSIKDKSLPTFDTLDFEEIQKELDRL